MNFDSPENGKQSRLLRWLALGAGAIIFGFSLFGVLSFSFSQILVLTFSVIISVFVSKYEAKIPTTKITFAPKVVFAFWGIMSLGVVGGVILAGSVAAAKYRRFYKNKIALFVAVSRDIVSTFVAAIVFYEVLTYFSGSQPTGIGAQLLIPNELIYAGILMAIVHYFTGSLFSFIFFKFESGQSDAAKMREIFLSPAAGHAVSFVATILLFLIFNHFGMELGLVIVPIALIGDVAYKIHLRRLEQKTKQISEASRVHLATVEALATAIDARDQVGMGHVRRTQIYAVGIGNILGLSEDEINALRTGALLHDIGKLAVPDHILNKPGRLTQAEAEKTKIHSSVGASILEKVGFQYPVVPTVKYHHECWDGSGHPEGLKGNNIPRTARIIAVSDAYDTLRGARPYRPAVSRADACNFLRAGAGTQFDPEIVTTFLRNLKSFEAEVESQGLSYKFDSDILGDPKAKPEEPTAPNYVEQIKRANREVFTLYEMARDFSSSLNLEETLSLFTKKVAEFVPFDTCLVYLLDESNDFATAIYVDGKHSAELKGKQVKVGEGATGYVLKKCKPVENVDPALDFAFSQSELSQEYMAMASLPLLADEKLIGAISLYSSELAIYEEEHLRLLETISRIAADAICNSMRHAETESHALTDPMTGLPNARSLQMQFDKEVGRAKRSESNFQLLVLDLDGFKAVNDTFGHKTGDKMLKAIGRVIQNELRDYDFLARYGGDEFVAIIPDTESADVIELCRRIETAVNDFKLRTVEGSFASVGVSLGSASYPSNGDTFDQMIISADKAMYLTKAFHKQRASRLEEQRQSKALSEMMEIPGEAAIIEQNEAPDQTGIVEPIEEYKAALAVFESDMVVELDESHIVSYSSIN